MNNDIYKQKYLKYKQKYNILKKSFKSKYFLSFFKKKKKSSSTKLLDTKDNSNESNEIIDIGENQDYKIYSLELNKFLNENNIDDIQININGTDYIITKYYELSNNFYIPKVYDYNYLNLFKNKDGIDFIKLEKLFNFLNNEEMNEKNKNIFNNIIFPFFISLCSASYIKTINKIPNFREKSFFTLIKNLDEIKIDEKNVDIIYDYITPFKDKYNSPTILLLALKGKENIYINIACKGTTKIDEWVKNLNFEAKDIMMEYDIYLNLINKINNNNAKIRIHKGYYEYIQNMLELIIPKINKLLHIFNHNKKIKLIINITGHSLGGGLATLFTLKLKEIYLKASINLVTFSAPRVVNNTFREYLKINKIYRIFNSKDLITQHPTPNESVIKKLFSKIPTPIKLSDIFNLLFDAQKTFSELVKNIDSHKEKFLKNKIGGSYNNLDIKNIDALHIIDDINKNKDKIHLNYQSNIDKIGIKKLSMNKYLIYHNAYCFDNNIFFTCGTPYDDENIINEIFFKSN